MKAFAWVQAATVDEALAALRRPSSVAKAGGVDLLDRLKEGLDAPERVVNLRGIAALDGIRADPEGGAKGGLWIGPLVTLARLAEDPLVRGRFGALAEAAGHAATPQVRNQATVGGNLAQRPRCWYFRSAEHLCLRKSGDHCFAIVPGGENAGHAIFDNQVCAIVHPSSLATALCALGARLDVKGPAGERTVPAGEFFVLPSQNVERENVLASGELITGVRVPSPPPGSRQAYLKIAAKDSFDWPIAEVAVLVESSAGVCARATIVLGGVSPVPRRAKEAEQALSGKPLNAQTVAAAARAAVLGATPLGQNAHKLPILETAVRRALLATLGGAP